MRIKFESLVLQCKKERVLIDLSHQISFFHGKIGSGKSSIVRLIDFTLGGNLEYTSALRQEMVTATLITKISVYNVVLERQIDSNAVQVTWINKEDEAASVLAPVQKSDSPIWKNNIFSLSDLLFFLMEMDPPKTRRSKLKEDTNMIRVSFRDFMWYCYLDQDHLDSSFFRLDDTFKSNKSRDVMRFVVGYQSEKLSKLESEYYQKKEEKMAKAASIQELREFLKKFGFESVEDLQRQIAVTEEKLSLAKMHRMKYETNYKTETHVGDNIRQNLRKLVIELSRVEESLEDLRRRIDEQTSLRSELLGSKFKLARSKSVASVLDKVKFSLCPSCGSDISNPNSKINECYLCKSELNSISDNQLPQIESLRLDIDSRIIDLENSIEIHKKSYNRQQKLLHKLKDSKRNLDRRLDEELRNYDSAYLAGFRQLDTEIATLRERLRSQNQLKKLPTEILRLEENIGFISGRIEILNRLIDEEKNNLKKANKLIKELEDIFKDTLLSIGFPGVSDEDAIKINRNTWNVSVIPNQNMDHMWDFENAGSGGKKTLFNVSYLLAVHQLAEANKLPLLNLVIIDTPMKNIGEDVNQEIFQKFYEHLYYLANGPLSETRFIIIDKDFILPTEEVDLYDRYMTPTDPNNPPLIPYYRGA